MSLSSPEVTIATRKELAMRKIVAGLYISLDGVVEAPEAWTGPYFNDEVGQTVGSLIVAEEIAALKQQPGRNINMSGSGTLVAWLLRQGLLDELHLLLFPLVVGQGKRLFEGMEAQVPLTLTGSTAFSNGVLHLTYQPAGA